ncbi:DNA-binding protein [Pseudomonas weihenstephanensis]|uniref:DNA-binding protein n=1 Tax=Pseudomonas weihenstephanensis TaxID=1608994 RepID=A0A0J6IPA2_9PSED|nr:TIGR02647 family protein [Pseudomonas weihenstephanensis]KMN13984.1 DNA-binding protein [Pseudomonas weihenstephanensis]
MTFPPELVAELEVLALFDLNSTQEGLKVHQDADNNLIAAAKRLHEKDLITQADGGYLTSLGRDAVEHVQTLLSILTSKPFAAVRLAEFA